METYVIAKFLVAAICMVCGINSKPTTEIIRAELQPLAIIAPISSQFHSQDNLGQYSYGYTDEHSSKIEVKTLDGITRGGYNYIDAEGKLQSVKYVSDATGFHVEATNLPHEIVENVAADDTVEIKASDDLTPQIKSEEVEKQEDTTEPKTIDEPIEKVAQTPIPPATIPIPTGVNLHPALLAPLPLHTIAPITTLRITPGIAYSYEYTLPPSTLHYTTFASHLNNDISIKTKEILETQEAVANDNFEQHPAVTEDVKAKNA